MIHVKTITGIQILSSMTRNSKLFSSESEMLYQGLLSKIWMLFSRDSSFFRL